MYKQIGQLLRDRQDEPLDKKFICDVLDIMISHDDLEEYVRGLSFVESELLGSYDNHTGIVKINIDGLSSGDRTNYVKKLNSLLILRHEIEHAKNFRTFNTSNGIEATVLGYSLIRTSASIEGHKESIYEVNPNERIADIRTFKFMVNLLKNRRNTPELNTSRENLYQSYIRGYLDMGGIIKPPTYRFLLQSGRIREYMYFVGFLGERPKYSLNTRVMCGLRITKEEKDQVLLLKSGLKNTNDR